MPREPRPAVLQPHHLESVGRVLFGDNWQSKLGRVAGLSPSSIKMMARGERTIHAGVVAILLSEINDRQRRLATLSKTLAAKLEKAS
jgi:hypothetical protein